MIMQLFLIVIGVKMIITQMTSIKGIRPWIESCNALDCIEAGCDPAAATVIKRITYFFNTACICDCTISRVFGIFKSQF